MIVDTDKTQPEYVDNGESQVMAQGAGIQTAERLSALGVKAVLSGYVGPKAFAALRAAGMEVYQDMDGRSVGEAVHVYTSGAASPAQGPNR